MKKIAIISLLSILMSFSAWSEIFFSGFAGGKADFTADQDEEEYEPELYFQSFFAGQFNLSPNVITHAEFSLKTDDIIDNSIFKETPATFQIDELSIIFRKAMMSSTNYLSFFIGTYEPIGSDIFLRRQFGIQPVTSKITESWLGIAGSVIYPLFGVGGSDIIHFDTQPIATGVYFYVNHENDDCYDLNFDYRFACVYRFFTFDLDFGLGLPLEQNSDDDAFFVVDKVYGRAGMNMLVGNSYTTSLFIQAGISDVPFTKEDDAIDYDEDCFYFLFEPRFKGKKVSCDLTFFNLPPDTVEDFIFVDDTLGMNLNFYTDSVYFKNHLITTGFHTGLTFPEKNYTDLNDMKKIFDDYDINFCPYFEAKLANGELHGMLQVNIMDIVDDGESWYKAIKLNIGYKTQF